jgi:hypothetical protein
VHEFAQTSSILKCHYSGYLCEQRVVTADAHIHSRFEFGPSLADDDGAAIDKFSGETLYAKPLGLAISSVSGASYSLFVCHSNLLTLHLDSINADL